MSLLMLPIYTRGLSPAEFGLFEMLDRSTEALLIALTFGMTIATLSFYQYECSRPDRQRKVFSTALGAVCVTASFTIAVLQYSSSNISVLLLRDATYAWAVRLILVTAFFELLFRMSVTYLQVSLKSKVFVALHAGRLLLALSLNLYLLLFLRWGLRGLLLTNLCHSAVFGVIACGRALRQSGVGFDIKLLREMARFGAPFVLGSVFLFVLDNVDRYFLLEYKGAAVVGVYGVGYRLSRMAEAIVAVPFASVWGANMIRTATGPDGPKLVGRAITYLAFLYLSAGLALSLFASDFVRLFAGAKYLGAERIVPIIVLAYSFWCLSGVADTGMYVERKTHLKPLIFASAAAICILLYRYLIPPYGAVGAAVATVISFFVFVVLTFFVSHKYFRVPYEYSRLAKLYGSALLLFYLGSHSGWTGSSMNILARGLCVISFPIVLWVAKFPEPDELARMRAWIRSGRPAHTGVHKPT